MSPGPVVWSGGRAARTRADHKSRGVRLAHAIKANSKEKETEGQRDRETESQRVRETERQRDRETERQRDRESERQSGRVT